MSCDPKCARTGTVHHSGRRLMISQGGNSKFPQGTKHGQCDECIKAELEHGKLMILFNNDATLVEIYEKLKGNL